MTAYYFFYLYLFVVSCIDIFSPHGKYFRLIENKLLLLSWIVLILFIGLRYKLGNDWYSYELIIDSIPPLFDANFGENMFYERNIEFGFVILISFINEIFTESSNRLQALIFLVSVFNYSILIFVIKKIDIIKYKLVFLSIYIGFSIFRDFDLLRQSISLYIFIFSLLYIKNKPIKYLFLNIFGSFFHISSLIFIPIYKYLNYKITKLFFFIFFIFFISLYLINNSFLHLSFSLLPSFISEKIEFLLSSSSPNYLSTTFIIIILISSLLIFFYRKLQLKDYYINLFINLFLLFILINIIFLSSSELQERFSYFFYFEISFILIILIDIIKSYSKFLFFLFISFLLCLPFLRFHRVIDGNSYADLVFLPYRNYLFQNDYSESSIYFNWNEKFNLR